MKLPESTKDFEKLMKNVDFTRIMQIAIPILQPIMIGGLWLLASRLDKRADALSKLIAIAEPIPTVDLNIPKPVVLASLYHSVDELADVLGDVLEFLQNLDVPSAEEIVEQVKDINMSMQKMTLSIELKKNLKQKSLIQHPLFIY